MPWHVKIPNALDKFPAQPLRQTSHRGSHRPGYICLSGCSLSFSMACYIRLSVLLQIHSEGMWVIQFVIPFPMTVKLIPFTVWPILIIEKYQKHSINCRSLVHFCYSLKKWQKKILLKILTQPMLQLCMPVGLFVTPYEHVCHLQACYHLLAWRSVSKRHLPSLQGIFCKYGHTRRTRSALRA